MANSPEISIFYCQCSMADSPKISMFDHQHSVADSSPIPIALTFTGHSVRAFDIVKYNRGQCIFIKASFWIKSASPSNIFRMAHT